MASKPEAFLGGQAMPLKSKYLFAKKDSPDTDKKDSDDKKKKKSYLAMRPEKLV